MAEAHSELLPPVLVVDDSPDDIFFIRRLLDKAGLRHPVITFLDSGDALNFLRAVADTAEATMLCPCLMFLDIKMPNVHGFVLLKWVRRQTSLDKMRVVMLSGSDEPKDHERAEKLGADEYLVKFPRVEEFARIIATLGATPAQA